MLEDTYSLDGAARSSDRAFVLSGCSGGGKSTLLAGLAAHGFAVAEEAGRQIVKEQMHFGGPALPSDNPVLFVELLASRAIHQWVTAARVEGTTVFDRSIIDGISFLEHLGLEVPAHLARAGERIRYNPVVLMVPPWPALFTLDAERRHGFDEAAAQYETLIRTYERFGYQPVPLPTCDIETRIGIVLSHVAR
jgi:predicted ATPase